MDDENELENRSIDIPIWKRYLLSVTEAAQLYYIGEKRFRQIVDIHPNRGVLSASRKQSFV